MGSLTEHSHKCLVPLAGKRLLEWQLEALHAAGVEDVIAVVGYRKEQITPLVPATVENPEWESTNMVASLLCARDVLRSGTAIICYADLCFHPRAVRRLLELDAGIAITYDRRWLELWGERFADPLEDAETFVQRDGRLVEIGRRTDDLALIGGQYMGLIRTDPAGWDRLERIVNGLDETQRRRLDMTSLLGRALAEKVEIAVVPVDGGWVEVDSEDDVRLYEERIRTVDRGGPAWSHDWRTLGAGG